MIREGEEGRAVEPFWVDSFSFPQKRCLSKRETEKRKEPFPSLHVAVSNLRVQDDSDVLLMGLMLSVGAQGAESAERDG